MIMEHIMAIGLALLVSLRFVLRSVVLE